ncbi:MAG: hypothetical protein HY075_02485 [Deltaproteobacteria bacterium]|nr:hypothetical protein [Deltaproteobacteria bacterium]
MRSNCSGWFGTCAAVFALSAAGALAGPAKAPTFDDAADCKNGATDKFPPDTVASKACPKPIVKGATGSGGLRDVFDYVYKEGLTTIDQLMPCLPAEYRRNFTLVYDSKSPHGKCGGPDNPRIMMYSDDGKSVITIPGNKKHEGPYDPECNRVEMVDFDSATAKFNPMAIQFEDPSKLPKDAAGQPKKAGVTTVNVALDAKATKSEQKEVRAVSATADFGGKACMTCHSADWHPKWDSYPMWPGVYGSMDDRLSGKEAADFKKFKAGTMASDERYKYLRTNPANALAPYNTLEKADIADMAARPNFALSVSLTRNNAERIARKFSESPKFDALKYRTVGRLLGCRQFPFAPDDQKKIDERKIEYQDAIQREMNLKVCRQVANEGTGSCSKDELESTKCLGQSKGLELNGKNGIVCRKSPPDPKKEKVPVPTYAQAQAEKFAKLSVVAEQFGIDPAEITMAVVNEVKSFTTMDVDNRTSQLIARAVFRRIAQKYPELADYVSSSGCTQDYVPGLKGASALCFYGADECPKIAPDAKPPGGSENTCEKLASLETKAGVKGDAACLTAVAPPDSGQAAKLNGIAKKYNSPLQGCTACHGMTMGDPGAFSVWIKSQGGPKAAAALLKKKLTAKNEGERMPLGKPALSDQEIKAVLDYTDEISEASK